MTHGSYSSPPHLQVWVGAWNGESPKSPVSHQLKELRLRASGAIFCGNVVLALPHRTVDDRNIVRFGIAANATAETAGQPHQVGIFEGFVRPGQRPPPPPKPTGTMPHAEVGVQNDPIHAIVAAAQDILIQSAQPICHGGYARRTPAYFKLPRRGHFFAARSAKKRRSLSYNSRSGGSSALKLRLRDTIGNDCRLFKRVRWACDGQRTNALEVWISTKPDTLLLLLQS